MLFPIGVRSIHPVGKNLPRLWAAPVFLCFSRICFNTLFFKPNISGNSFQIFFQVHRFALEPQRYLGLPVLFPITSQLDMKELVWKSWTVTTVVFKDVWGNLWTLSKRTDLDCQRTWNIIFISKSLWQPQLKLYRAGMTKVDAKCRKWKW